MAIPDYFGPGAPNLIASYDAIDIITGTGIVKLYAGGIADANGIKYRLDRNAFWTSTTAAGATQTYQRYTTATTTDTTFTKVIDLSFDTGTLNHPMVLRGNLLANIPIGQAVPSGGISDAYCNLKVIKITAAGGTEDIAEMSSATISPFAANSDEYFSFITAVPSTKFVKGEQIRLTVELWSDMTTAPGPINYIMPHDPQSASITLANYPSFTAGYTSMEFLVPFKIAL